MKAEFRYILEKSDILKYMKVPPAEKLQWLEEICDLTRKTETPESKRIRQPFRDEDKKQFGEHD